MQKIYVVKTSHLDATAGRKLAENIISFVSKKEAERYMEERRKSSVKDTEYLAKEGVFDTRWWIEEVSLGDAVLDADANDRLVTNWITSTNDNGYIDYTCGNCLWTIQLDPATKLGYNYCPKCAYRMQNPNGEAKK